MSVRELLTEYGLKPNKALGQNFLTDGAAIERIVDLAAEPGLPVLEIGPGLGALTVPLAERGLPLAAVELDRALADILRERLGERARIINADFLKANLEEIHASLGGGGLTVAGNLPYYVTSPICQRLVLSGLPIGRMVLMMQSEAAERFLAAPKDKSYGPLTVMSGCLYEITPVMELSPASYFPMPEVRSTVLLFEGRGRSLPDGLPRLLKGAFAMRRKTLVNNLASMGLSRSEAEAALLDAGLSPSVRAEELDEPAFLRLNSAVLARL